MKQQLINLRNRIEWEGGLCEYIISGGTLPTELQLYEIELRLAYSKLNLKLNSLYDEYDVKVY